MSSPERRRYWRRIRKAASTGLIDRWQRACASMHNIAPGDGIYIRGRLHVYAGFAQTPTGFVGRRWVHFCCECGQPVESVQSAFSATAIISSAPDENGVRQPRWQGPQRCKAHVDPQKTTPFGFENAALRRLQHQGLSDFHEPEFHYVSRKDPGDTLERLGVTIDRRAELLAELFLGVDKPDTI